MNQSKFIIARQIEPPTGREFMILEVVPTSDGRRTRVCNDVYETLKEAQKAVAERKNA